MLNSETGLVDEGRAWHLPKIFEGQGKAPVTEMEHQALVISYCKHMANNGYPKLGLIFHIANGGMRSKSEAAKLKCMGVRKGVSDLFLPVMAGGKGGLWIEMKKPDGGTEKEQDEWLEAMQDGGYQACVAKGYQEAINAINSYLGIGNSYFGIGEESES